MPRPSGGSCHRNKEAFLSFFLSLLPHSPPSRRRWFEAQGSPQFSKLQVQFIIRCQTHFDHPFKTVEDVFGAALSSSTSLTLSPSHPYHALSLSTPASERCSIAPRFLSSLLLLKLHSRTSFIPPARSPPLDPSPSLSPPLPHPHPKAPT